MSQISPTAHPRLVIHLILKLNSGSRVCVWIHLVKSKHGRKRFTFNMVLANLGRMENFQLSYDTARLSWISLRERTASNWLVVRHDFIS